MQLICVHLRASACIYGQTMDPPVLTGRDRLVIHDSAMQNGPRYRLDGADH